MYGDSPPLGDRTPQIHKGEDRERYCQDGGSEIGRRYGESENAPHQQDGERRMVHPDDSAGERQEI